MEHLAWPCEQRSVSRILPTMVPPLIALACCLLALPALGQIESRPQAIVNGTRAPELVTMTASQIAAIGYLAGPRDPTQSFCTGTLISDRVVVTAEHCVTYRGAGQVVFGLGDPATTDEIFEVEAVFKHPELDIALFRLTEPATRPTPLAWQRGALDARVGDDAEAAGYGDLGNGTQDGRFFVVLPIVDIQTETIDVDGEGTRGICQGDSGGPLLMMIDGKPTVLAVESIGDESCVGRDTLIRTAGVEAWIEAGLAGELDADPAPEGCGDLDFLGRCTGDVAEWCDPDGVPASADCAANNQFCSYIDDDFGFYCVDRAVGDCTLEESICVAAGVRRYCIRGRVEDEDCNAKGLRCEVIETGAWCVDEAGNPVAPPPVGDGCCRIGQGDDAQGWWVLALLLGWRVRRRG